MRYFVRMTLKNNQNKVAKIVYANSEYEAINIATNDIEELLLEHDTLVDTSYVISYYELGVRACTIDPSIKHVRGEYYYYGHRISNDAHFLNGFGHEYERLAKLISLNEDREAHY